MAITTTLTQEGFDLIFNSSFNFTAPDLRLVYDLPFGTVQYNLEFTRKNSTTIATINSISGDNELLLKVPKNTNLPHSLRIVSSGYNNETVFYLVIEGGVSSITQDDVILYNEIGFSFPVL